MKKWKLLLNIVTVVGLGALSGQVWGANGCDINFGSQEIVKNVTLPDIVIPPGATVGTQLAVLELANASTIVGCNSAANQSIRYGNPGILKTGGTLPTDVYSIKTVTNVDSGIGVKVTSTNSFFLKVTKNPPLWEDWRTGSGTSSTSLRGLKATFYKTGAITPGELQFPANFLEGWVSKYNSFSTYGGVRFATINITGSPKVKIPSCETPDLTVNLGKHAKADFGGIGATSSETPFDFVLNNCSPGMTAVKFTFKPAAGITLVNSGTAAQHLSLKSDSTASGVGVQVLYQDGTLIPFNTANSIPLGSTDYNASTGGTFKVPMKARYIQTASTVSGGTANSAVEFTMSYE